MKRLLGIMLVIAVAAVPGFSAEPQSKMTERDQIGYSYGYVNGRTLNQHGIDLPLEKILEGLRAGYLGGKSALNDEEMSKSLQSLQKEFAAKRAEAVKKQGDQNKTEGDAFLAENKKKDGVIVTASGLQYKVLASGTGKQPQESESVKVHYRGTLLNGAEFDSSLKRGQPATFALNGIIPGWREALRLMKEGDKWQLFIPSGLAYGERGAPPSIGPNQTLQFEVELLEVIPKK
ncbi:MAG TPA: FKBP-type peptidyl-prolyl cis-trans isomerase [Dissulfurispiraceae bacterium]|nr:FKBP-type peptidyl-prolyl cis-trans isomerase [Dissulfurispiraceae bacterium]